MKIPEMVFMKAFFLPADALLEEAEAADLDGDESAVELLDVPLMLPSM